MSAADDLRLIIPEWARYLCRNGIASLAKVTQAYNWHKGRLRGSRAHACLLRDPHRRDMERAIDAEVFLVDAEFATFKHAWEARRVRC